MVAERLTGIIERLCRDHFEGGSQNKLNLDDLKVTVEMVRDVKQESIIGGLLIHAAMKDEDSFMIAAYGERFQIDDREW